MNEDELRRENDVLRGLLGNSALPCAHCGLPAADWGKCQYGFPGCARTDDASLLACWTAQFQVFCLRQDRKDIVEALQLMLVRADLDPLVLRHDVTRLLRNLQGVTENES